MNKNFLETVKSEEPTEINVYIETSAEMDEMWSFCHDKSQQIWLWWAVDHKQILRLPIHSEQENINIWMNFLNCFPNSILVQFMPTTILRTAAEFHPTGLLQEREIRSKLKEII